MITKKQLAIFLSKLKSFKNPKIDLEQYPSDSEYLSDILWHALLFGHIKDKIILDPGCGTGIIAIGAKLLGAKEVIAIDIDEEAIKIAKENAKTSNINITFVQTDFLKLKKKDLNKKINTVIQNPPFGTRQKHLDIKFIKKSMEFSEILYSIHKESTRKYLETFIEKNNCKIFFDFSFSFPLKQTYKHHIKKIERIKTICLGFQRSTNK